MRLYSVTVVYQNTGMSSCGDNRMPHVQINENICFHQAANCDSDSKYMFYPLKMTTPDQCVYISPSSTAHYVESVFIEIGEPVSICEVILDWLKT